MSYFLELVRKVAKVSFVLLGIFWVVTQIFSNLLFEQTAIFFETNFGLSQSIYDDTPAESTKQLAEIIITTQFFYIFFAMSTTFAILGAFILARKRSIYDFILLFSAFILPRERSNLGLIKDKEKNKAIPFAIISAFSNDEKMELVVQSVADSDGRYNLNLKPASYKIKVAATGYKDFMTEIVAPVGQISEFTFVDNIFLSKESNLSNFKKLISNQDRLFTLLTVLIYISTIIYLLIFGLYFFTYRGSFYAQVNITLFVIAFVLNSINLWQRYFQKPKMVLDRNNNPIAGVIVNYYKNGEIESSEVTDDFGFIRLPLGKGKHLLRLARPGYKTIKREFRFTNKGTLAESIYLDFEGEKTEQGLFNPFGG